jgi:hypothetical protein
VLFQRQPHPERCACLAGEGGGGAAHKVGAWIFPVERGGKRTGDGEPEPVRGEGRQPVADVGGENDERLEQVITIVALAHDVQGKVDLCPGELGRITGR